VPRGRLITLEGADGAGKTTLARALAPALRERHRVEVLALREPGGVPLAERVRALVTDPALRCGARAEALLYAAARAQLVEEALEPALAAGTWVLLDRYVDSSLAYQGGGRGLGIEAVRAINAFGVHGVLPQRTLYLRVSAAERARRLAARGAPPDRLEGAGAAFFAAVTAAYDELAAREPERIAVLDADAPPAAVLQAALAALA
jgi:dTMP kinase